MSIKKEGIWVGTEDLNADPSFVDQARKEFFEVPMANDLANEDVAESSSTNRRDFLKYMGFSIGAAALAASCDTPVRRAIPYVVKPDAIVPGVANYYASSIVKGGDYCPVLVKTREGRPIKIEGNKLSPFSSGGTSARAQGAVLELYDTARFKSPMMRTNGGDASKISWQELDANIAKALNGNSRVAVVSHTIVSPTLRQAIQDFANQYSNTRLVEYDPVSCAAMLDANEMNYGVRAIPDIKFEEADYIVNFGADFLGTWVSPVEYASRWIKKRKITDTHHPEQSRMVMVESAMSLTGSNADNRISVKPSQMSGAIAQVHNGLMRELGGNTVSSNARLDAKSSAKLNKVIEDVLSAINDGKKVLFLSGTNSLQDHLMINAINYNLNAGLLDFSNASHLRKGDDKAMARLIRDLEGGNIDALIFLGDANPAYDLPEASAFGNAMKNVQLSISMTGTPNETAAQCKYICPDHHNLEAWSDAQPYSNMVSLIQPTIAPMFDTRSAGESLLTWAGVELSGDEESTPYYNYLRANWERAFFPRQSAYGDFRAFWDQTLHDGYAVLQPVAREESSGYQAASTGAINTPAPADTEIVYYESIQLGAGQYANNPWLQEMPDPVHRTVWDNFLTVPTIYDGNNTIEGLNGLKDGDLVSATIEGTEMTVPVVATFSHPEGITSAALGYGRKVCGRAGREVGFDVFPMLKRDRDGYVQYFGTANIGEKVGRDKDFASVQYHHTYGLKEEEGGINVDEKAIMTIGSGAQGALTDRSVIFHSNVSDLEENIEALKEHRAEAQHLNEQTIYEGFDELYSAGHKWEMAVDLSACIGCGACQVACIAENNVPVVGKREVSRHHEMTWLRIDRYYYGDLDSPNVVYQPMMCQHCDNAPCENVCPVGATNHSGEGLNQMTYNRCIGTRYCANNCPYKVRRFNWLDYTTADLFGLNENDPLPGESEVPFYADNLTRMVLNPDVTIRSRGVIEKCSFCVQRIQEVKLEAKVNKRGLRDGDIQTACVTACPTGAIQFGDINDKDSQVSKMKDSDLNYYVLEEINVRASVGYHMKVINKNEEINKVEA